MYIFSTTVYKSFSQKIARYLGLRLSGLDISRFADGEIYVHVREDVFDKDVVLVGGTAPPAENIIELVLSIDALKRQRPRKLYIVIPYFGYGRADHIVEKGEALSGQVFSKFISQKADKVIAIDLHSKRVERFFGKKLIHIRAGKYIGYKSKQQFFKKVNRKPSSVVVVVPDNGALDQARQIAIGLGVKTAWMEKTRPAHNVATIGAIHGSVKDKTAIVVDDMIDTAGTIIKACEKLHQAGARDIMIAVTHLILSPPAVSRLKKAKITKVFATDTIVLSKEKKFNKLHIISVVPLICDVLKKELK